MHNTQQVVSIRVLITASANQTAELILPIRVKDDISQPDSRAHSAHKRQSIHGKPLRSSQHNATAAYVGKPGGTSIDQSFSDRQGRVVVTGKHTRHSRRVGEDRTSHKYLPTSLRRVVIKL
ncbi:hypothetical protein BaRGS_00013832 [Batillaria attramentaria]|uniref:Uncharacterized protein n=1 Tax=Batillaria attramentaria TaxID=370345 RepID=A0ABD0L6K4_9CAEN